MKRDTKNDEACNEARQKVMLEPFLLFEDRRGSNLNTEIYLFDNFLIFQDNLIYI